MVAVERQSSDRRVWHEFLKVIPALTGSITLVEFPINESVPMSEITQRHQLPYIMAAQAQKHVTHNEALRLLDGLSSLYLIETEENSPPAQPNSADSYALGSAPTGDWQNHGGDIAMFIDGAWMFSAPFEGLRAYRMSDAKLIIFQSEQWEPVLNESTKLPLLGINTDADQLNKLSVKSDSVLFGTDDQEANPTGDVRLSLNRTGNLDNSSMLFQTNYATNAEIGCSGDKHFRIKVSDDGTQFKDAVEIDESTGYAGFGRTPVHALDVKDDKDGALARIRLENTKTTAGSGVAFTLNAGNGQLTQFLQYASAASYLVTSSNSLYLQATGSTPKLRFFTGSIEGLRITKDYLKLTVPIRLASHIVSQLPSASLAGAGAQIYVSDETGGAVTAFSDGTDWRRSTDREIVS